MTEEVGRQILYFFSMVSAVGAGWMVFSLVERFRDRRVKERQSDRDEVLQHERLKSEIDRTRLEEKRLRSQIELEDRRMRTEEKRAGLELELRLRQEKREEEARQREAERVTESAGAGSGGYIFIELPEQHRPVFHDLLKGFEEYAQLQGYGISFSIDSTFTNRVAFKFTLKDDGIAIGTARVRRDFQDYVEKVRGGAEAFDDLPIITSIEEHELLVTVLKNRVSFLQTVTGSPRTLFSFTKGSSVG